jgi:hypothetical protein
MIRGAKLNGWDLACRARELNAFVPAMYISGTCAHEHSTRGYPDSQIVRKPFTSAQTMKAKQSLQAE